MTPQSTTPDDLTAVTRWPHLQPCQFAEQTPTPMLTSDASVPAPEDRYVFTFFFSTPALPPSQRYDSELLPGLDFLPPTPSPPAPMTTTSGEPTSLVALPMCTVRAQCKCALELYVSRCI